MKKKDINLLICLLIFSFLLLVFTNSNSIIKTIYKSSEIWFYNIVPTIFPIYIVVDLLLNYNAINYLNYFLGNFMEAFFKIKKESSLVFLLSIISGFPSNSKYLKTLLDNKTINEKEALKLLTFTHFANPLFIIESIGVNFLKDKKIGIIILMVHYLTNVIIGFFNRNYYLAKKNLSQEETKPLKQSFVNVLTNSIFNTFKILILLYGIITFFMMITTILQAILPFNNTINSLICGILEMTQGVYYVSILKIPLILKATLMTFFISFGGFSIHLQVFSILHDYKLKYSDYLIARITHGIIASSLVFLILYFFK